MAERPIEILLVEEDAALAEAVAHCLSDGAWSNVTHVSTAAEAMREELTARHDLIIASTLLPDTDGLDLVREIRVSNRCPIILTTESPSVEEAVDALRLRVTDLITKPYDLPEMVELAHKICERGRKRRHRERRYRRLRSMVSRIIRERRDLRQRMDLICRDLVHAYRSLAQKVAKSGVLTSETTE